MTELIYNKVDLFQNQKKDFENYSIIAGVDEAGRGPLAGPLVVAAVILEPEAYHPDLNDSKKLNEIKRNIINEWVYENCITSTTAIIPVEDIDEFNILNATLMGMMDCIELLCIKPDLALIDGNLIPKGLDVKSLPIIKGDGKYACIAAASIIAKVMRDELMLKLDKEYPQYDFKTNKGYPTKKHIDLINKYGLSPVHRKTFKIKKSTPSLF